MLEILEIRRNPKWLRIFVIETMYLWLNHNYYTDASVPKFQCFNGYFYLFKKIHIETYTMFPIVFYRNCLI